MICMCVTDVQCDLLVACVCGSTTSIKAMFKLTQMKLVWDE